MTNEFISMTLQVSRSLKQRVEPEITRLPDELSKAVARKLQRGLQDSKENEICFSMWDFAGQELYYTTHQVIKIVITIECSCIVVLFHPILLPMPHDYCD